MPRPRLPDVSPQLAWLEIARRAARSDFGAFVQFTKPDYEMCWYHQLICEAMDDVVEGKCKKLIVVLAPRHGKSELSSRRLPAYWLGKNPKAQIIITSYGFELVKSFSRDIRRIMESKLYEITFPEAKLAKDAASLERWETTKGGVVLAQGIGGSIVGHGGDLIVLDDLIANREQAESEAYVEKMWDYYTGSLFTRLQPGGAIVIVMHRWSTRDIVGRLLSGEEAGEWRVLRFPAEAELPVESYDQRKPGEYLWPDRYGKETFDAVKVNSMYDWESLYQGRPYARAGRYIKAEWLKEVDEDQVPANLVWVRGYDLAISTKKRADFTASVKVARHEIGGVPVFYVAGGWFDRLEWPVCKARAVELAKVERCALYVEAVAGFAVAEQELSEALKGLVPVTAIGVSSDKLMRAIAWIDACASGRLVLVKRKVGDNRWIDEFRRQAETFPTAGEHDDLMDALSVAWEGLSKYYIDPHVTGDNDKPEKPDEDKAYKDFLACKDLD